MILCREHGGLIFQGTDGLPFTLNGQTITSSNEVYTLWAQADSLIIKDSAETGGVKNTGSGSNNIAIVVNGNNTNVKIESGNFSGNYAVFIQNGAKVSIDGGKFNGTYGVAVIGKKEVSEPQTSVEILDGEIIAKEFAVAGNGSADYTNIMISGGKLTAENGTVVYHPQVGNMTVKGTAELTGANGIQFCGAGILTIEETPVIKGTAAYTEFPSKPSDQGDGSTDDGAALSIISRGNGYQSEGQSMTVNLNGGTLVSEHNATVSVYRLEKKDNEWVTNDKTSIKSYLSSLTVRGGTYLEKGQKPVFEIDALAEDSLNVTGGTFSSDVSKYADNENGYFSPKNGETYEVVKFGKINVFQEDGTLIGTYDSFRDALAEVNDISKYSGKVKLVCDAGTYIANGGNHIPVTRSILVEGNGAAVVPGTTSLQGEADFAIEESLGQAEGINNLKCDTQIVVEDLYNAAVWGTRKTEYNLTVELNNCDTHEIADKTGQRVYINGTTGKNCITLKNCDIKNQRCTVYSNAPGSINIEDCSFANTAEPININTKAAEGTVSVSVRNTRFLNCGLGTSNDAQWAAPIRVVKTGSDKGKSNVTVDNCIFNYTNGNKPANGDVLIGEGRDGKTSYPVEAKITNTKADIKVQTPGFYLADGSKDETKQVKKTVEKNQTAIITPEKEIVIENEIPPYIPPTTPVQKPTIEAEEGATVTLSKDGTTATIVVDKDAALKDVLLNGKSLGAVTEVPNLKTGDKLVVVVETAAEKNDRIRAGVENTTIKLYYNKKEIGKGWIKLRYKKSYGYKVDNYEIFRSAKKKTNFGDEAWFVTKTNKTKGFYKNGKSVKKGTRYYYKMRGVREIAGETVYTQWSNIMMRTGR